MTNFQSGYVSPCNLFDQYQYVLTAIEIAYEIMTNNITFDALPKVTI